MVTRFRAFYTGTVGGGSDLSGVTVKGLAALDAELENSGKPATLANGALPQARLPTARSRRPSSASVR